MSMKKEAGEQKAEVEIKLKRKAESKLTFALKMTALLTYTKEIKSDL